MLNIRTMKGRSRLSSLPDRLEDRTRAEANYSISMGTMVRTYREKIFPRLAVNGWRLKQKASEVDKLAEAVEKLRDALTQVERENTAYKTRVDNLQSDLARIEEEKVSREALRSLEDRYESVLSYMKSLGEVFDVFYKKDPDKLFLMLREKMEEE